MKTPIPPRDWQLLSEYLDNQLNSDQKARLEARLQSSPSLQEALASLRQTRQMLRSLPQLKAPRSFKLTPEMVGVRPARRIYPVFQLASVLAGLLLVVAVIAENVGAPLPAAAPAQEVALMSTEVVEDAALDASGKEAYSQEAPLAAPVPAEPAGAAPAQPEAPDTLRAIGQPTGALTATPPPGELEMAMPAAENEALQEPSIAMAMTPEPTLPMDMPPAAPDAAQVAEAEAAAAAAAEGDAPPPVNPWRVAQVALVVIGLSAGLLALYFRKRGI